MTRVNVVPPIELWDNHLLAELREIPRIPNGVLRGAVRSEPVATYRMGKGHVLFFTDKLCWLNKRYNELYLESLRRGFNVRYRYPNVSGTAEWEPDSKDLEINRSRLEERRPKCLHSNDDGYIYFCGKDAKWVSYKNGLPVYFCDQDKHKVRLYCEQAPERL